MVHGPGAFDWFVSGAGSEYAIGIARSRHHVMQWSVNIMAAGIIGLLVFAAWVDVATRIIPDGVSIAVAALGIGCRLFDGLSAVAISILLGLLIFALLVLAHARGILGGGDVKLAAAMAVGLPADLVYRFVVVTALAGGVLGLVHLAFRYGLRQPPRALPRRELLRRVLAVERWRIARHGSLPYGVAIASGGIWTILTRGGG
jgi:Flp pilus assembly protein protease CpaA